MELIRAAHILPIEGDPIPDGAIVVELGIIKAVGPAKDLLNEYSKAVVREFPHHVLLPGLVNAHCHLDLTNFSMESRTSRATSGRDTDGDEALVPHIDWLIKSIAYKQGSMLDQLAAAIKRGIAQLVQTGTTCAGIFAGYDGIPSILEGSGLRAVLFPDIFVSGPADRAQDRYESALALIEDFGDAHPNHLRIGLGPWAPYLLSKHVLRLISDHARHAAIPVAIHAAESFAEMEFFFDSTGPIGMQLFPAVGWGSAGIGELPPAFRKTPIKYLGEIGFLDTAPLIIGGVHLGGNDFDELVRHGCRVVCCPRANKAFGHGQFPFDKLQQHNIPVGLGTEATTQLADGNLWEEMRAAMDQSGLPPRTILHMATLGGAKALGWGHKLGSLVPGKAADFIVCDMPGQVEPPFLCDALIRHTTPSHVRCTVVGGQWLKTS